MNAKTNSLPALLVVAFVFAGCAGVPAASAPSTAPSQTSLLPDGIWEVELTPDEFIAAGAPASEPHGGVFRWTFNETRARIYVEDDRDGTFECDADASPAAEGVRLEYRDGPCGGEVDIIQWAVEADGLHLSLVETNAPFAVNQAYLEAKPWQSVDGDATLTWATEDSEE